MGECKKLDRLCRICTVEADGICIFSEEGKRNKLEAKIKKYLYIAVSVEDKLPKMVCSNCSKTLDGVHKFASMAIKMQEKLNEFLKIQSEELATKSEISDDDEYHSGSLLHSILTNGQNCGSRESSPNPEVTEVEVRVDPMLFLCELDEASIDIDPQTEVSNNSIQEEQQHQQQHLLSESQKESKPNEPVNNSIKDMKPYQCSVCPRGFNSEISLQNHLWSHLSRKVLTNSDLNTRYRYKKGSVYSSNGVLHTVSEPVSSCNPYTCPMCGKQISTKGNLKVHLETHRPKGKYGCDICGRIFKTQSNLYRHKEYHGGVQFTCPTCGRVYPTKSTLRAHSITHSDLRPHKCPLCDKTFKRNQDLKFHINQHTGARPYQCPYCPKAFASSGNCFSHRKRMHPGEIERDREIVDEIVQ